MGHLVTDHCGQSCLGLSDGQYPRENDDLAVGEDHSVGWLHLDDHRFPGVAAPEFRRVDDPIGNPLNHRHDLGGFGPRSTPKTGQSSTPENRPVR